MAGGRKLRVAFARCIVERCMFVCWLVGMISLLSVGSIETAAIWQPAHPDAVHQYPRQIKGTIRYITGQQKTILSFAMPGMWGGLAAFFVLAIPYEALKRRDEGQRMQRLRGSQWSDV